MSTFQRNSEGEGVSVTPLGLAAGRGSRFLHKCRRNLLWSKCARRAQPKSGKQTPNVGRAEPVMSTAMKYLDLASAETGGGHPINLWWHESQPDRIHLILADPRLVDAEGEKPGLRLVLSCNPKSADYSPANFNRCARVLRGLGMPAPDQDVPEHPRHLKFRDKVIAGAGGSVPLVASTEAAVCPECVVLTPDLQAHLKVAH